MIEIIGCSAEDAIAISSSGADRIELVGAPSLGGLTPTLATIERVLSVATVPVVVIVRPREGDFFYSNSEISVMAEEICQIAKLKPAGIITGALHRPAKIDSDFFRKAVDLADEVSILCHRCFDLVDSPEATLEELVSLGVKRVLTSGQHPTALEGTENLRRWHQSFGQTIEILPGSGIRSHNLAHLLKETGIPRIHASAWGAPFNDSALPVSFGPYQRVCPDAVEGLVRQWKSFFN